LRIAAWVLAGNDKDRFAELNSALDKALAVFAVSLLHLVCSLFDADCAQSSEIIDTKAEVLRHNAEMFTTVVATAHQVNDVERSMTVGKIDVSWPILTLMFVARSP
jgi:hypothetical protein